MATRVCDEGLVPTSTEAAPKSLTSLVTPSDGSAEPHHVPEGLERLVSLSVNLRDFASVSPLVQPGRVFRSSQVISKTDLKVLGVTVRRGARAGGAATRRGLVHWIGPAWLTTPLSALHRQSWTCGSRAYYARRMATTSGSACVAGWPPG